ncbi:MAG: hypothetical protein HQM10_05240 [Candidatus Riflebacteria bacterium]|nr:hypothetical protein [Candidatus Riflebacteria bacterium]
MKKNRIKIFIFISLVIIISAISSQLDASQKHLTMMIYMNADNNLDPYGQENLKQMAEVGSNEYFNVVVLCDRRNAPASLIYVEKNNLRVLKNLGEIDMGSYQTLVTFARETIAAFPAEKYVLEIWNHGSGWRNSPENPSYRGISYDEASNTHIKTEELDTALGMINQYLGRKLDVLMYDACLMQMAEVACIIKGKADLIVGSEDNVPGRGFPYNKILGNYIPNMSMLEFSAMVARTYVLSIMTGPDQYAPATLSVLDGNKIDVIQQALESFCSIVIKGNYGMQVREALRRTQKFTVPDHRDLRHFLINLKKQPIDMNLFQAIEKLESACSQVILVNEFNNNFMAMAGGIAVYFPDIATDYKVNYDNAAFSKISNWDDMVRDSYRKAGVRDIVISALNGDMDLLKNFVADQKSKSEKNAAFDCEFCNLLADQLNYEAFCENSAASSVKFEIARFACELKGMIR